ncbi:MAG: hypothetical protein J5I93_08470 [Pirellulaceae bacterium]|nr:hypothetical protein [Pirellulaceae bacterium]
MSPLALVRCRVSCRALAVRFWLATALGLVAVLGGSERAAASCGRYVVFQGSAARMLPHGRSLTPADIESPPPEPFQQPPAPCDGPQCHGRDWLPPLAPPAVPPQTGHEQSALLGDTDLLHLAGRGHWVEASDDTPQAGHRSPIERPPRA